MEMKARRDMDSSSGSPILELVEVTKSFGAVRAVDGVSMMVKAGAVTCLLGDNGAGKSTLIHLMSGVDAPTSGELRLDGHSIRFESPRDAQNAGIATVHQDDGTFALMSITRNFFLGREIVRGKGPARRLDVPAMSKIALEQLAVMGLTRVQDGRQMVGTLSGGERQALAISRALYFGARLLILDEPTAALGVKEAGIVLRLVQQVQAQGVAVVFITHNAHHAMTIGDLFVVLIRGQVAARFARGERTAAELLDLMAGGEELEALARELEAARR
jgi:simple sugar transport system ATP-binding protein